MPEGLAMGLPVDLPKSYLRWFCGHREAFADATRTVLMQTLLTNTPAMVLGALSVMMLAGVSAVRLPGSVWPYIWFGLDLLLLGARLTLIAAAKRQLLRGEPRQFYLYVCVGTGWCMVLGVGACLCVLSGDGVLTALAGINVSGIAAGISSRSAAFPRLAIMQIACVGIPYAVGAAFTPVPWFFILAIETPMCLAAMCSLALTHHSASVNLIRAERENWFLAFHDALTGLPNRSSIRERLDQSCEELRAADPSLPESFAVLCLDLDGFKSVNDNFGHPAGDMLLRAVADRLRLEVRASDTVARLGGDEFVILLPGASVAEAARISVRIIAAIAHPFQLGLPAPVSVGTTIGSAFAPADGATGDVLLARADQALYHAKRAGRGVYRTYAEAALPADAA